MRLFTVLLNLTRKVSNVEESYKYLGQVSSGSPMPITLPNAIRGLIHVSGGNATRTALFSVVTSTVGVVSCFPIYNGGSVIGFTTDTNKITITSTNSNNSYVAYIGRYASEVVGGVTRRLIRWLLPHGKVVTA